MDSVIWKQRKKEKDNLFMCKSLSKLESQKLMKKTTTVLDKALRMDSFVALVLYLSTYKYMARV